MTYTPLSDSITLIDIPAKPISTAQDFLEMMMNAPSNNLVIHQKDLTDSFFDLKSGLAGDILQKVANYRMRIAIVGDFSNYESKSLRDFIYESNKGTTVNFVASVQERVREWKGRVRNH